MKKNLKSLIVTFKAYNSLKNSVKHSLSGSNLNVNEFATMEALYVKGPITTQELIDSILIPNSSMTYILEILSNKNYIKRKKKIEDKRVQLVSLTEAGTKIFEEIYARHFEYMRSIFNVLSQSEEDTLQALLKKVGKKAEERL